MGMEGRRQTDIELIVSFRSYANERKNGEDSANILRILRNIH
jgi:hypothetical protein